MSDLSVEFNKYMLKLKKTKSYNTFIKNFFILSPVLWGIHTQIYMYKYPTKQKDVRKDLFPSRISS